MGLDQFIFAKLKTSNKKESDIEVAYFRKFNALQNYFEENFDQENCEDTNLTYDIVVDLIDRLERVVKAKEVGNTDTAEELFPTTSGFFYGDTSYNEYYFEKVKEALRLFRQIEKEYFDDEELNSDYESLYYTCWY